MSISNLGASERLIADLRPHEYRYRVGGGLQMQMELPEGGRSRSSAMGQDYSSAAARTGSSRFGYTLHPAVAALPLRAIMSVFQERT